jgi:hypothetical protein
MHHCFVALCIACAVGGAAAGDRPPLPASWDRSRVTGFPGLPADARHVAERAAGCLHFAGEINGDGGERDRDVAARMDALGCRTIDAEVSEMRAKYPDDVDLQRAFDLVSGD